MKRTRGPDATKVTEMVTFSDSSAPAPAAVYVERELPRGGVPAYLAARRSGVRSFALWSDDRRRERTAAVVTLSAGAACRDTR
ncbi:hypothetical protein ACFQ60_00765 [Streptomyces zhihengii]